MHRYSHCTRRRVAWPDQVCSLRPVRRKPARASVTRCRRDSRQVERYPGCGPGMRPSPVCPPVPAAAFPPFVPVSPSRHSSGTYPREVPIGSHEETRACRRSSSLRCPLQGCGLPSRTSLPHSARSDHRHTGGCTPYQAPSVFAPVLGSPGSTPVAPDRSRSRRRFPCTPS